MVSFPYTEVKSVKRWTNYSGSLPERGIPTYCTPDVFGETGNAVPRKLRRNGEALRSIIAHCFESDTTLTTIGSRWSFSKIVEPGKLVVDPANLNAIYQVKRDWLDADYKQRRPEFSPMLVQGGTHIGRLNRRLLQRGLALQTSGAGDGQRLAGALSTGTHGSALNVGAMHDTALGFHLITAPDQSVFLQPKEGACGIEVVEWLRRETGLFVEAVNDDELFAAAQVGLGSLGFVHAIVMETAPLYALQTRILNRPFGDAAVWNTLDDLDTRRLHPDVDAPPFHFEVVFHPYPVTGRPGAFVKLMWKRPGDEAPHDSPMPAAPDMSSDHMGLIAALSAAIDGPLPSIAIRLLVAEQLEKRYKPGDRQPAVPGMVFGPSGLPAGHGASTEVVVEQSQTRRALELLYEVLSTQAARGNHLLGAVAVRFIPRTQALLGMSMRSMNAYIELPSIRNAEVLEIYRLWWDALEVAAIPFTCHWGQMHGMTPARLRTYFGDRVDRFRTARQRLLPDDVARRVFASRILPEVGLD